MANLLGANATISAEEAVQAWAQRYTGPTNGSNEPRALALALNGNVFVTGASVGTGGYIDMVTIAYADDGTPIWTNRYDGTGHTYDAARALALDTLSGRVYVTGYSWNPTGYDDFATLAYRSDGKPLWTNRFNLAYGNYAQACSVAVGSTGTVFVGGSVGGQYPQYVTVAYSGSGEPLWTNCYSPGPGLSAQMIAGAVGPQGNFYVTGSSEPTRLKVDYATLAYSASGVALWTNFYNGPANGLDNPFAIAVDNSNGNVYVTGWSEGIGTRRDFATVAYSSSGVPLWTNRFNGSGNGSDAANAVAVGQNGNVFVTGGVESVEGGGQFATIAYSAQGLPLWTNYYRGATDPVNSAGAVAVDHDGTVIVTGISYSAVSVTREDIVTLGYSASGSALWTNRYNGPANGMDYLSGPNCLGVDPDGAIYVAGGSQATNSMDNLYDFVLIKYVPMPEIRIAGLTLLPNMWCRLMLSAPTNVAYRLEASSGLTGAWETLTNFPPLPVTSLQYTDTLAPLFPTRFYRTVWSP